MFTGVEGWDDNLPDQPGAAQAVARRAADRIGFEIAQRESAAQHDDPGAQAQMREDNAADYYDFHRAATLADSGSMGAAYLARHQRTAAIAAELRRGVINSPATAAARATEIAQENGVADDDLDKAAREGAREFMLWRHSIHVDGGPFLFAGDKLPALIAHLGDSHGPASVKELSGMHYTLDNSFGALTRSNKAIHVGIVAPRDDYGPRALGITDESHPNVGSIALAHDATRDDLTREMAQSLARRHLAPTYNEFARRLTNRTARSVDHADEYSDHGYRSAPGAAGNPLAEFGHTYSRAMVGHGPQAHPAIERALGPTRRSAEDMGVVMDGANVDPGEFRDGPAASYAE